MNSSGTSSRHYRTLNIDAPCSWSQLKQQYRKLANTWHPDRLQDNPEKLSIAENKLKEINLAYAFFSNYFKEHGSLPALEQKIPDPTEAKVEPEYKSDLDPERTEETVEYRPFNDFDATIDPVESENSSGTRRRVTTIFLLFLAAIIGWNYVDQTDSSREADLLREELHPDQHTKPADEVYNLGKKPEIRQPPKNRKYFSYGSTLGQVHDAQGTPTRTKGDTWYYGESKVHFKNGRVSGWKISHDDPLFVLKDTLNINRSNYFVIGSSKERVQYIQGKPTQKSNDTWDYGLSRVYFFDGQVVNWYSSPMNPLKARK